MKDTEKRRDAAFTIAAANYMASAGVLGRSLKETNENLDFYIFLVDGRGEGEYVEEPQVIDAVTIGLEEFETMAFKYNVIEFSTAIKPFCMDYLMKRDYSRILYIDPDIYVYGSLDPVLRLLEDHSLVLTPHSVEAQTEQKELHFEKLFLRCGIFNLGFMAVNSSAEGKEIVKWWMNRLEKECFDNEETFVDQKWMNYAPVLFENVYILKDREYNIAFWNFQERELSVRDEDFYVRQEGEWRKLCFMHFSGYKPSGPINFSAIQENREQQEIYGALFKSYGFKLEQARFHEIRREPYGYGVFREGSAILPLHRQLYNELLRRGIVFYAPFDCGRDSYYELLKRNKLLAFAGPQKGQTRLKSKKSSKIRLLNRMWSIFCRSIGAERYTLFLSYLKNIYCKDSQLFLLGRTDRKRLEIDDENN